jgi:hypothetical protein
MRAEVRRLIERASELARSGPVSSVFELDRRLAKEGHTYGDVRRQKGAPSIRRQLSELCKASARGPASAVA